MKQLTNRIGRAVTMALALAIPLAGPAQPRAWAYDAAVTQAGLTERAAFASSLHKVLVGRLQLGLGLYQPLVLDGRLLEPDARRRLEARLGALDPGQGYRPVALGDGRWEATALSWLVAGTVLEETPAEAARNHFYDPRTGRGLDDARAGAGASMALRQALDGAAGLRRLATGAAFDLTGRSALEWVMAGDNPQGVPAFLARLEDAIAGAAAAERESALASALLALGGVLGVLEDLGQPAHVRNDFRSAYAATSGVGGPWDRVSRFERHVADTLGRNGIPEPAAAVRRPNLLAFFSAPDGMGLADRTQRRFFSEGTVPRELPIDARARNKDLVGAAAAGLPYPSPTITGLNLRDAGKRRYLMIDGRAALAYERRPDRVRFLLDERVFAETAQALLPEIGAYATGLLDHVFRGELVLAVDADGRTTVRVRGVAKDATPSRLRVTVEDSSGHRREIAARMMPPGADAADDAGWLVADVSVPPGAKRVAAVLAGSDAGGPFVAFAATPAK